MNSFFDLLFTNEIIFISEDLFKCEFIKNNLLTNTIYFCGNGLNKPYQICINNGQWSKLRIAMVKTCKGVIPPAAIITYLSFCFLPI